MGMGRGGSGVCAQGRRPEHIAAQGETSPSQKGIVWIFLGIIVKG